MNEFAAQGASFVVHRPFAFNNLTNDARAGLAHTAQLLEHQLGGIACACEHKPYAHVEGSIHIGSRNFPLVLEKGEDRRDRPGAAIDNRGGPLGQNPWQIICQPAAGNVRHSLHQTARQYRADNLEVRAVRPKQSLADRGVQLRHR